jgi:hypothetical protein
MVSVTWEKCFFFTEKYTGGRETGVIFCIVLALPQAVILGKTNFSLRANWVVVIVACPVHNIEYLCKLILKTK